MSAELPEVTSPESSEWLQLTPSTIRAAVEAYPSHVPSKLQELDEARLKTIPDALQKRKDKGENKVYLEKDELVKLVEWKLKHGTFRPRLLSLATSNTSERVKLATREAFDFYDHTITLAEAPEKALRTLTTLSGIGPATASLLLASYDPANVPFFSDELYQLAYGKQRKIRYTVNEYTGLWVAVQDLREQLDGDVTALELEQAAWAMARDKSLKPKSADREPKVENNPPKAESEPADSGDIGSGEQQPSENAQSSDNRRGLRKRAAPPTESATQPQKKSKKGRRKL